MISLLIRLLLAFTYRGFETDTACFYSWANMLWENGFANFYSPDYFCDYPPGYLYVLYGLGGLLHVFDLDTLSGGSLLIIKLPAILCDMVTGYLVYHYAGKYFSRKTALLLSACYLLHPAVLINSSIWGQVDAVYTLSILIVCLLLTQKKTVPAYFMYAVCILIKPQALMFAPLLICAFAEYIISHKNFKLIVCNFLNGLMALCVPAVLSLPFGLKNVIAQYTSTLSSYPYAAVNACNLWGLFGQNWISQETKLGFLTYAQIGTICIVLMTLATFLLFYALRKRQDRFFITGAFLVISMFIFSVRMHERYLFPAMILLLFAYLHNHDKQYFCHYWLISACHFCNVFYVLKYYDPSNYDRRSFFLLYASFLTVLCGIFFYISLYRTAKGKESSIVWDSPVNILYQKIRPASHNKPPIQASRDKMPFLLWDGIIMVAVSLIYGVFAFINLGITAAPVTECAFPYNTYLELDAREDQQISNIYWYLLNEQDITCGLEIKQTPDSEWQAMSELELKSVFCWDGVSLPYPACAVRITNLTEDTNIGELVFTDAMNDPVDIKQADIYAPLFDEESTFPGILSAQTGSYFDEIYYNRTVYEFMHGLPTYENTHPPFGKILIMVGALLFGTTPFGFRFMGALFGVLMLPFVYLLGRNITKSRFIGAFAAFLFAFDFMHFAQTRLATIDVFITFFVIIMYYFMERYTAVSFYDTPLQKTFIPLGACGIAFGFGIASKWTGAYAGAGLALIFFMQLYKRYREYRYALTEPDGCCNNIEYSHIIAHFKEYTLKTIGFCVLFFVVIPFTIYLLSYIPFVHNDHPGLFDKMINNQITMFRYHSELEATHPYSSVWYEWPTMIRPIFYYARELGGDLRRGISSFGNPLVWWTGIPAFLLTCYWALCRCEKTAVFLTVGYLAQYLPWILVDRCTFIYHYFPSVPFLVWMIGYCTLQLKKRMSATLFYVCCTTYAVAAFLLFLRFYPILAGTPVSVEYVDTYLRWLSGWVFVLN